MGNSGAKKTNQMLQQEGNAAAARSAKYGGFGQEERNFGNQSRSDIYGKYQDLYNDIDTNGLGGGGGGYIPHYADPRMNEAMAGYRDFASTGGFDTGQAQDYRARATSTLPAMYEGYKTSLESANRAAGGNVGFNSQIAKIAREKAYGANQVASSTEADLQDMIRKNKLLGLEGVGKYDTEYMNRLREIEQLRQAAASAGSARARASANDALNYKLKILGEERGLRQEEGTDLPYWALEGGAAGQQIGTTNARVSETPFWQTALGAVVPAAVGAFGPGFGKKKPAGGSAGPMPSPYGYG